VPAKLVQYFKVLNCDSLCGLSLLTRGRLCVLVTPRSASSNATGLEAILLPRSAWIVNWRTGTFSAAMVASSNCSARDADSRVATIHPTCGLDPSFRPAQARHSSRL